MSFVSSFLLLIIFKTQSVHTDGITFLDAELFKLIENSRLLEEILEEAESLLGIQVRVSEHLLDLRTSTTYTPSSTVTVYGSSS